MTVFLLRHGQTRGNLERRSPGPPDEPLCPQGKAELEGVRPPEAEYVYVSPMIRCRETAAILYPGMEHIAVPGFRETGFGIFEGHTYEELKETPAYRAWLDTAGAVPPPGGESKAAVRQRVTEAFLSLAAGHGPEDRVALVVHGGTIMTLLEAFEASGRFYDWQPPNGGGWRCRWRDGVLTDVEKL